LKDKDIEHFRKRLLEERQNIQDELDWVESNYIGSSQRDSSGEVSGHATHLADMATDSSEREKAYLIGDTRGEVLEDIGEALEKLKKGTYGVCESCEQPIPEERLEAVPHAKLCLKCKTDEERGRGASR
jgi:RNA polymerase-binding protein DksA